MGSWDACEQQALGFPVAPLCQQNPGAAAGLISCLLSRHPFLALAAHDLPR